MKEYENLWSSDVLRTDLNILHRQHTWIWHGLYNLLHSFFLFEHVYVKFTKNTEIVETCSLYSILNNPPPKIHPKEVSIVQKLLQPTKSSC